MAETFEFGLAAAEDIEKGYGTFNSDLPDGSQDNVLSRLNLSHLLAPVTVEFVIEPVFDLQSGIVQTITLTGDVTGGTIQNGDSDAVPESALIVLRIVQDGTGGRAFAFPSSVTGAATLADSIDKTASAETTVVLLYNGTAWTPIALLSGGKPVRLYMAGRALSASDFALSAGWGTTASVSAVAGNDSRFRVTVTSAGTGQGAAPTVTLTYVDGLWAVAPFAVVSRNGGSSPTVAPTWATTTTALVLTMPSTFTPVAAATYTFEAVLLG